MTLYAFARQFMMMNVTNCTFLKLKFNDFARRNRTVRILQFQMVSLERIIITLRKMNVHLVLIKIFSNRVKESGSFEEDKLFENKTLVSISASPNLINLRMLNFKHILKMIYVNIYMIYVNSFNFKIKIR